MSNPTKKDEIETYLANIGAKQTIIFNGEKRYTIPGHVLSYSLMELLEASEEGYVAKPNRNIKK